MTYSQSPAPGYSKGVAIWGIGIPLLSSLFFLAIFFLPGIGLGLNFFAPLPLIYYFFRFGRKQWHIATLTSAAVIVIFLGFRMGMFYLLTYCFMALLIAELILRKETAQKIISLAAIIPLLATVFFFIISAPLPLSELYAQLIAVAQNFLSQTATAYKDAGLADEQVQMLLRNMDEIAKWVVHLMPATMAVGYFLLAYGNFLGYRRLWSRLLSLPKPDPLPVKLWSPPEKLVFVLIIALAAILPGREPWNVIGANLLIVTVAIYVAGGASITEFFLEKFRVPLFLRLVIYMLVIIQPFFLSMVAGFGLFDLWFDFRKIRAGKKGGDGNSENSMEE